MVIDTSAIFAAIANEPDGDSYRRAIKTAPLRLISAITLLETRIVLFARFGGGAIATFEELMERARIAVVPFDHELCNAAFDAFRRFGKGQGKPAQLNIVDCAAYALARQRGLPLLFKGADFAATDVQPALLPNP
jgi:ribonuclease VapC